MSLTKKEIESPERVRRKINEGKSLRGRAGVKPKTSSEAIKKRVCGFFVNYKRKNKLSCLDLADLLEISEKQMEEVLAYHIEEFSSDFALDLLDTLLKKDPAPGKEIKSIA